VSEFNLAELKAWRKKHGLSQGQLANLAHLSVITILNIEAGRKIRDRSRDELLRAIEEIERRETAQVAKMPDAVKPEVAVSVVKADIPPLNQIQLSNLDLELINRIFQMNPKEQLKLLERMLG
jgi:transcriptional regulator with XRE-family HTH domain